MHTASARNREARVWLPVAKRYFEAISGARKENIDALHRRGVVAAALATFRYQPEKAAEFWRGLAAEDYRGQTDPRATLASYLRRRDGDTRVVELDVHAVARAWNAFYRGRKLKVIKVCGLLFDIEGTPVLHLSVSREG